ncbi:hypothetical protein, partial [Klebsiella pneumoniae]|uniref:hypothetical protein n=1 Tax=Klebsiella pneumoniae TaxID=573 RepID=UPI0027314CE2
RLGGFPGGLDGKESALNAGNLGSFSGSGRSSEKGMATTPVFLPGEFHGQKLQSMGLQRVEYD